MLIRSYLLNNIQFENDYKKYLKTRNTFFSPTNIENKNKEYMKKKDFMKILKRFEIKSKNSNNNSQK
jgi:predicted adenine nucleotide alpha hydrolase (AANH) superfamily ATPase